MSAESDPMDPREMQDRIQRAIADAVQNAVGEHERGFVTRWAAVIESVSPDGERGVWGMAADDMKAWDTIGLLEFGLAVERASIVADKVHGGTD